MELIGAAGDFMPEFEHTLTTLINTSALEQIVACPSISGVRQTQSTLIDAVPLGTGFTVLRRLNQSSELNVDFSPTHSQVITHMLY